MSRKAARVALPLAGALVLAALLFTLLDRFDNKYTHPGAQPIGGILYADAADMDASPVRFLIGDWEYYPGLLLSPADFAGAPPQPGGYAYVGQYGGFHGGDAGREGTGQASYRLTLLLEEESAGYALWVPEIYAACRIWVDGELLLSLGETGMEGAAYRDEVGRVVVPFTASGRVQLLVQAACQNFHYAGMTHPMAFGRAAAVTSLENGWQLPRTAALVLALVGAVFFLSVSFAAGYPNGRLFALLCLCFAACCGYPLLRAVTAAPLQPWAGIYLFCYYAMFPLILLLAARVCGVGRRARTVAALAGLVFSLVAALALPVLSGGGQLAFALIVDIYKWLMAALLAAAALWAAWGGKSFHAPLLFAAAFFAFSMAFDRVYSLYEPVRGGWFWEIGGLGVICVLGGVLWADMVGQVRQRARLAQALENAGRTARMQAAHYDELERQMEATRALRHDFRQQLLLIGSYADSGDLPALRDFLARYGRQLEQGPATYTKNRIINAVLGYYGRQAEGEGIAYDAEAALPERLALPEEDLVVALGNLLENALEAARRLPPGAEPFIRARLRAEAGALYITVDNRFDGNLTRGKEGLASAKRGGAAPGQGLASIASAAARHGGQFRHAAEGDVFRASVMLPLAE